MFFRIRVDLFSEVIGVQQGKQEVTTLSPFYKINQVYPFLFIT